MPDLSVPESVIEEAARSVADERRLCYTPWNLREVVSQSAPSIAAWARKQAIAEAVDVIGGYLMTCRMLRMEPSTKGLRDRMVDLDALAAQDEGDKTDADA